MVFVCLCVCLLVLGAIIRIFVELLIYTLLKNTITQPRVEAKYSVALLYIFFWCAYVCMHVALTSAVHDGTQGQGNRCLMALHARLHTPAPRGLAAVHARLTQSRAPRGSIVDGPGGSQAPRPRLQQAGDPNYAHI